MICTLDKRKTGSIYNVTEYFAWILQLDIKINELFLKNLSQQISPVREAHVPLTTGWSEAIWHNDSINSTESQTLPGNKISWNKDVVILVGKHQSRTSL